MADDTQVETEAVAWWRRGLIVLAVLTAAGGEAWVFAHSAPDLTAGYAVWIAAPGAPLIFVRDGRVFRVACTAVAVGLFVSAVLFLLFGAFVLAPAGLVVLAAGWADRDHLRKVVLRTTSLLIAVVSLIDWTITDVQAFRPADTFVVHFDPHGYAENSDILAPLLGGPPPFGRGATGVSIGGSDTAPEWMVDYRPDLSEREKTSLENYLRGLPAVVSVAPCDPPPWGCR